MSIYVDTHTHVSDEAFSGEVEAIVSRAMSAGVTRMLLADIDSRERGAMLAAADAYPGILFPMIGLYPGSVDKNWQREVEALQEAARTRHFVAVGEIGLDYHFQTMFVEEQKEALKCQLELAAKWNLPVNIHLRDATESFFSVLESCRHLGLRGNLHAYSGSYETFLRLSRYGDWSIGVGGVVTFKKAGLAEVVKKVPLDRILLETDAPYLAPVPLRGTRNESANIPIVAAKVAELKNIDIEQVAAVTTANAEKLFKI